MLKLIPTILFILTTVPLLSQGIQETFGKNRIQYHDDFDDWWMYETENFVTHWYGKSRNVGIAAMQIAEKDYFEIQNILEHRINDKIEILVYVDQTDVKQSNLGNEETYYSRTGQTTVSGNKIFVYYDGNHQHLVTQIREGIATVYLDAIMFGSNLQEFVQNTISLKIPEWYKLGLISFIGHEWNIELDARLRELFNNRLPDKKFERLANLYPEELGHAFWFYVAKTYGKSTLANIIYLTRINKTHKKAFLFILGVPFSQIAEECLEYFRNRYQVENQYFSPPNSEYLVKTKNKKFQQITSIKWNADATMLAYVVMDQGKAKVYIYDTQEDRTFQIWKTGFRNNIQETDFNYPVMAWHPHQNQLMIFDEKRDVIRQLLFDLEEGSLVEDVASPLLQRIYSAAYLNPETLILSATQDGYSNLFQYNLRYRTVEPITDDIYDDLQVNIFDQEGKTAIIFASNRGNPNEYHDPDSTLPIGKLDLYQLYIINDTFAISRLTKTPNINEYLPIRLDENSVHFLSEESGVVNRKKKVILENTSGFLTNYSHNILTYDVKSNRVAEVIHKEDKDHLYIYPLSDEWIKPGYSTYISMLFPDKAGLTQNVDDLINPPEDALTKTISEARDTNEYLFQSEFSDPEATVFEKLDIQEPEAILTSEDLPTTDQHIEAPVVFQFSRMIASRLKFKFDRFFSNLDNNLLFGGLNTYAGQKMGFEYPPMGILFKASIEDVFEDYGFEGGIRIPTSFDGSEYFVIFDDKKRRIDKRYALYKKSRFVDEEGTSILGNRAHETTFIGLTQWSYPLSVYTSVRSIATFRLDKRTQLASDLASLESAGMNDQRLGLRFEFIFDNALEIDLNIRHGTRVKTYVELVKKMQIQLFEPWKFDFNEGFMTIIGVDARHYLKLDRNSIIANRLAASTSFGSERILYFMGGVDNWLFPAYNEDVPVPPSNSYAFNTLAAHLRGFRQNIRNGTSYALINSELRVPLFKYLFPHKKHSLFLRNFQLTAFADVGTAWHGSNPFSAENPLNIISVNNPLVTVDVSYSRSPIVVGYGAGARLYLLGYFIRADYGWGLENGIVKDPRLYIAFGVDF